MFHLQPISFRQSLQPQKWLWPYLIPALLVFLPNKRLKKQQLPAFAKEWISSFHHNIFSIKIYYSTHQLSHSSSFSVSVCIFAILSYFPFFLTNVYGTVLRAETQSDLFNGVQSWRPLYKFPGLHQRWSRSDRAPLSHWIWSHAFRELHKESQVQRPWCFSSATGYLFNFTGKESKSTRSSCSSIFSLHWSPCCFVSSNFSF